MALVVSRIALGRPVRVPVPTVCTRAAGRDEARGKRRRTACADECRCLERWIRRATVPRHGDCTACENGASLRHACGQGGPRRCLEGRNRAPAQHRRLLGKRVARRIPAPRQRKGGSGSRVTDQKQRFGWTLVPRWDDAQPLPAPSHQHSQPPRGNSSLKSPRNRKEFRKYKLFSGRN